MLRALPYCLLSLCVFILFFYLENYRPQVMADILLEVDFFGWSDIAQVEQDRLDKIKNLTIPYEEKQVLVRRTVFMGATTEMVGLALGKPMKTYEANALVDGANIHQVYLVYYLPGDKRPTFFVFRNDVLMDAYKGSALDIR
jgi:hypothetical protein